MTSLLMPFGFLISLALGVAVFGVTGTLDRRALEQAERQRLELSLNVQAASFRGNVHPVGGGSANLERLLSPTSRGQSTCQAVKD